MDCFICRYDTFEKGRLRIVIDIDIRVGGSLSEEPCNKKSRTHCYFVTIAAAVPHKVSGKVSKQR